MSNGRKIADLIVGTEVKVTVVDSDLDNIISSLKTRLDSDDAKLQSLDTAINQGIVNVADSDLIINQLTAKINSAVTNIDSDSAAAQAANTQIGIIKGRLDSDSGRLQALDVALSAEITATNTDISAVKGRLDSDDGRLQALDTSITVVNTRIDSDEGAIQAAKTLIGAAVSGQGMADSDLKVVADLRNQLDSEIVYIRNFNISYTNYTYIATAGQTSFTGSDANSYTLSYTVGSIQVFLNGVRLEDTDYTATDGTSITLTEAAQVSAQVTIICPKLESNYVAPPTPPVQITNSRYAIINISANQDFDSEHSEPVVAGGANFPYSVFKDETGNTSPRPKHIDLSNNRFGAEYGSGTLTFHSNSSPYHSGGFSASFKKNRGLRMTSTGGGLNNPGSGACTWEFWVFIRPQHHSQNPNNSQKRSIAISGATSQSNPNSDPTNNTWAIGIHGIQGNSNMGTGTGIYLAYRQNNTNYLKTWNEGREDSELERNKWHHIAIVRSSGTDGAGVYKCYMNGEQMESEDYATFPDDMDHSRQISWWGGYGGEYGRAAYGGGLYGNIMDYRLTHDAKYTSEGFDLPTSPMNVGGFPESDVNCAWPWGPSLRPRSGQSAVGTGLDNNTNIMNWSRPMNIVSGTSNLTTMGTILDVGIERTSPYDYDTEDYNKAGSVIFLPRGGNSRQLRTGIVSNAVTYGNIESITSSAGTGSDGGIDLGNGDCTIEWWANCYGSTSGRGGVSTNNEEQTMVDFRPNGSFGRPHIYIYNVGGTSNRIRVHHSTSSGSIAMDSNNIKVLSGSWYHYAYVRTGQYVKFYINGIRVDGTGDGMYVGTVNWSGHDARPFWGAQSRYMRTDDRSEGGNFNGLMADCRVTVGTAVYTGQFTPPTKPLTVTGGTYPLSTNIANIGTGHVKQLLQFKNNPIKDTAGSQPFMAPTYTDNNTGGLPPRLVISDEAGISNWPTTEPSALGGGSTAGKKYMYFYGGGSSSSNKMVKNFVAWPSNYHDAFIHNRTNNGGLNMHEGIPNTQANQRRGVAITIEAWIYPHQSNTGEENHYLFSYGSNNENSGIFALRLEQQSSPGTPDQTGSNFGWIFERDNVDFDFATGQSFNQWYHVALVWAGSLGLGAEWRFFVNGNRDTTVSSIDQTTSSLFRGRGSLSLGSDYLKPGQEMNGYNDSPNNRQNFHGIVRNFRVEHRAKYWDNNFTPTDFTLA